jgi:hypothetical protein
MAERAPSFWLLGRFDGTDVDDRLAARVREALVGERTEPEDDQNRADEDRRLH